MKDFTHEFKNNWNRLGEGELKATFDMGEDYIDFLSVSKTERLACTEIQRRAEEKGYVALEDYISGKAKLVAGSKVYAVNRAKSIVLFVMGTEGLEKGMNIVGAHIDSPRLDLKPNPLYESDDLAYFKTHYYGGVKKFQWVSIPLALHGTVVKSNGEKVDISIGEEPTDPVFFITDILPHLSKDQDKRTSREVIMGEELNLLIGSMPVDDVLALEVLNDPNAKANSLKDKVKHNILNLLNSLYGIKEVDFFRSEFEIVPAGRARDMGFDRSMVCGYGQDDRVCSFAALRAIFDIENPAITASAMFMDKEEIGSVGSTGSESVFFENVVCELLALQGVANTDLSLRRSFTNTKVLSADVSAGFDPTFTWAFEKQNSAFLGRGVSISKYTGSGGKYSTSDANAEFVAEVISRFDNGGVLWQSCELGKVDQGGGGTIAYILANRGAEVLDVGVPVLSMHGTYEVSSKVDIYMAYRGYKAFME